jgi:hypothetical protein
MTIMKQQDAAVIEPSLVADSNSHLAQIGNPLTLIQVQKQHEQLLGSVLRQGRELAETIAREERGFLEEVD